MTESYANLPERVIQDIQRLDIMEKEKKYDQIIEPLKKLFLFYCKHLEQSLARNTLQRLSNAICQISDSSIYQYFTEFLFYDCMESTGKHHQIVASVFQDYKNLILYTLEHVTINLAHQFFSSRSKYFDSLRYRLDVKDKDPLMEKFDKERIWILDQILEWILILEDYKHPQENISFYQDFVIFLKYKIGTTISYNTDSWMSIFMQLNSTDWTSLDDIIDINDYPITVKQAIDLLSSWNYSMPTFPWKIFADIFQESCNKVKELISNPSLDIEYPISTQLTKNSTLVSRIHLLDNNLTLNESKRLCKELLCRLHEQSFPKLVFHLKKKLARIEWDFSNQPLPCIQMFEDLYSKYKMDWDTGYSLIQLYIIQSIINQDKSYSTKALDLSQSMITTMNKERLNRLNILISWIYYTMKEYNLALSIWKNCIAEYWIDWYQYALITWMHSITPQSIISTDSIILPKDMEICRKILSSLLLCLQTNNDKDSIIYNASDKTLVWECLGHFYFGLYCNTNNYFYKQKAIQCYQKCSIMLPLSGYFLSKLSNTFDFLSMDISLNSEYHIIRLLYIIPWNESIGLWWMRKGKISLEKSNYSDAITFLQYSLKENSSNSISWYWLACSYYENRQYIPSYKAFQMFEKYCKDNQVMKSNMSIYKIQILYYLGKIEQAREILDSNKFSDNISLFLNELLGINHESDVSTVDNYVLLYHLAHSMPKCTIEYKINTDQTLWIWSICESFAECLPWLNCLERFLSCSSKHNYNNLFISIILYHLAVILHKHKRDESIKLWRSSIIACPKNFYSWNALGVSFHRHDHFALSKYCFMMAMDIVEQLLSKDIESKKEWMNEKILSPIWCNLAVLYQGYHASRVQYCIDKAKSLNPLWPITWIIDATRLEDDDSNSSDILSYCEQSHRLIQSVYPKLKESTFIDSLFMIYTHWFLYSKYIQNKNNLVDLKFDNSCSTLYNMLWHELLQNNSKEALKVLYNQNDIDIISLHSSRLQIELDKEITFLNKPPSDTRLISLFHLVYGWKLLFHERNFDECLKNLKIVHMNMDSPWNNILQEMIYKVLYMTGDNNAHFAKQCINDSSDAYASLMLLMINCIEGNSVNASLDSYKSKRMIRRHPIYDPRLDIEPLIHIYSFLYPSSKDRFKAYICRWILLFPSVFEFKDLVKDII